MSWRQEGTSLMHDEEKRSGLDVAPSSLGVAVRPSPGLHTVVVAVDGSRRGVRLARRAVRLASALSWPVRVLLGVRRPSPPFSDGFAHGEGIASALEDQRRREDFKAALACDGLRRRLTSNGALDIVPIWFDSAAADIDVPSGALIVVADPPLRHGAEALSAPRLLMDGRGPVLILPDAAEAPWDGCALIAWNGSTAARAAVADALSLIERMRRAVLLVIDGAATATSAGAVAHDLRHRGIDTHTVFTSSEGASVAEAIIAVAHDVGATVVILGGYSRSATLERLFGGVTERLLAGTPLALFLSSKPGAEAAAIDERQLGEDAVGYDHVADSRQTWETHNDRPNSENPR